MPLEFHGNPAAKYRQQVDNALEYIVPFLEEVAPLDGAHVLEIGCAEGGVLQALLEKGCTVVGVDLNAGKIANANKFNAPAVADGRAKFVLSDIHEPDVAAELKSKFDLIVLKDTIEHVYEREKLMTAIRDFLKPGGRVFLGFPPWFMPFGGHQQMTDSKLGKLPYYHLLPRPMYRGMLRLFGESEARVDGLMEIVDTRITIQGFRSVVKRTGFRIAREQFYLLNPIYKYKFGVTPRRQIPLLRSIPWLRDVFTTTCYYLIEPDSN